MLSVVVLTNLLSYRLSPFTSVHNTFNSTLLDRAFFNSPRLFLLSLAYHNFFNFIEYIILHTYIIIWCSMYIPYSPRVSLHLQVLDMRVP